LSKKVFIMIDRCTTSRLRFTWCIWVLSQSTRRSWITARQCLWICCTGNAQILKK